MPNTNVERHVPKIYEILLFQITLIYVDVYVVKLQLLVKMRFSVLWGVLKGSLGHLGCQGSHATGLNRILASKMVQKWCPKPQKNDSFPETYVYVIFIFIFQRLACKF